MFNCRAGAIILDSGRILMVKNTDSSFYYTVGGRVKFGEASRDVVLREVYEETQIRFEIDRLAFIHENFFVMKDNGEKYHEICLFYLMKPNAQAASIAEGRIIEESYEVTLHWLPVGGLGGMPVYPEFFKTELGRLSGGAGHFVTRDGATVRAE